MKGGVCDQLAGLEEDPVGQLVLTGETPDVQLVLAEVPRPGHDLFRVREPDRSQFRLDIVRQGCGELPSLPIRRH